MVEISYPHTDFDFINENEKKNAQDFLKKTIEKSEELTQIFSHINATQKVEIIKNDNGILGFKVEQKWGDLQNFTRYYDIQEKKLLQASDIFFPQEKFQNLIDFIQTKNSDLELEPTNEDFKSFIFEKNGDVGFMFKYATNIFLKREEIAPFINNKLRFRFGVPPEIDCGKVPCVALTFDDGPSVHTPRLLDILKENDAKATFFVLGIMVNQYPEILKRTHQEGHQIGNHTWNHKDLKKLTKQGVEYQILETNKIIKEKIGQEPTILRPPYGSFNPMVATTADMPIILWDIDPLDWKNRNTKDVANRMAKAERNSIILAHDIHKTTIDSVPLAIKELKAKGFHFVTVEDLFYGMELKKGGTYNKRN